MVHEWLIFLSAFLFLLSASRQKKISILHHQCLCVVIVTASIDFYLMLQMHIRRFYPYMTNKLGNVLWATAVAGINSGSTIAFIWIMFIYICCVCGPSLPSELTTFRRSNTLSPCHLYVTGDSAAILLPWILLVFLMIKNTLSKMKN